MVSPDCLPQKFGCGTLPPQAELTRVTEYWGRKPQKTQLDRIKAKPDPIIKKLAAQAGQIRRRGSSPNSPQSGTQPSA
jgi:hypothetical protein